MKKKYLFGMMVMTAGIMMSGCGQREESKTAQVEQGNTKNERVYGMEDAASKTETEMKTEANTGADAAGEGQTISEEEAKEIAIQDANVAEADLTGIRVKLEEDDGRMVYDVEFYVQEKEFDYEIDRATGKIIDKDFEIELAYSGNQ